MTDKDLLTTNQPDIEDQVIGEILNNQEQLADVAAILKPEHFQKNKNKTIYEIILNLNAEDEPIDVLSIAEEIKKNDRGNSFNVTDVIALTENIISSANVVYHARMLFDKYIKREFRNKYNDIIKRLDNEDVFDLIGEAEQQFSRLTTEYDSKAAGEKSLFERLDDIYNDLLERRNGVKDEDALILQTLPTLNSYIGGIMPTDLIAIYGKEKSTKTTLAHEIAMDIGADQKKAVAIFTFENSQQEADWKSLSMRTGIDFNKLRNPKGFNLDSRLSDEDLKELKEGILQKFLRTKIFICDQVLNEIAIANKIKIWKKKHDLKLVVIDYLMLIESIQKFQNRREELNYLSRFFKRLAMQVKVPIILISQSNQEGERVAEAKGLERDSNYFIYVQAGMKNQQVAFRDKHLGEFSYTLGEDEYIVTLRGVRHSRGNRSFITKFSNNRYVEVDTRNNQIPSIIQNHIEKVGEEFPI